MEDEEVRRVLDAINALGKQGDATDRARRLTQLLDEWPDKHAEVREMRQRAVAEMHASGLSYRKIGELLGISFGRVKQIIDGVTNPRSQKRADTE
ncbi:hypothetical protein [Streptacidiphilus sp. MAP5-3]|uniref:hypothetical protein n=1 Tax=unclassified Streptacidiphilus TaxID=2643834 RepID=UPI0035117D15